MTPKRFTEVFKAAVTLEGAGIPIMWCAHSPLVMQVGRELVCSGETPEAALLSLVAKAVQVRFERMAEASKALRDAEEDWRRVEAAAAEMDLPGTVAAESDVDK